ncbi:MAG: ABC transporter ATP-binding protein [Flavobacteriaceae bacterium]|nr:ABC transporter ATP-binding protein [Flavobacteriaceae bacterium]
MEDSEILITVDQLTKSFKKTTVIENLTHSFKAGERIALVGQNGAGKTTLIRCLLGLYKYNGTIEVLGMNPRKERELILQNIGFVPQIPPPIKMTVGEMLDFFGKLTNTDKQEFIDISENLGLDVKGNLNKPFMKLSGGMKQKLLVSFALGRKPKILLMDEPAANLDPKARSILFDYLHNFDKNALMIISSHRIDEVEDLVNRLIEMDMGKIVVNKEV